MVENSYEEARRQRLEENKKRFQELGISEISTSLTQLSNSRNKSQPQRRLSKPKPKETETSELRRSSRARNAVASYRDDVDIDLPSLRKRSRSYSSSWASYLARPIDEVKTASYEERMKAIDAAEHLQENLQSGNPSFVKSMVRSHVYSCFWLGLPTRFCEDHLSKSVEDMVLEDEDGTEYDAVYIGKRTGLSGGWRGFALDHKLDDGDAVVFELVQPSRFKVYIIRASSIMSQESEEDVADKGLTNSTTKRKTRGGKKLDSVSSKKKSFPTSKEVQGKDVAHDKIEYIGESQKPRQRGRPTNASKLKQEESVNDGRKVASGKPSKEPTPRLLRNRVLKREA